MKSDFIPYSLPEIGKEELEAVNKVLSSGWITTGNITESFEEDFKEYIFKESKNCYSLAVNSATAGLHLALEACGIKEGDEVITSTLTFTATAEVIRYLGAEVRLVDVDPATLNLDLNSLVEAINEKTKAIMPVHFAGKSCDMDKIYEIAKRFNLKVIDDAAHALPSTYKKKMVGDMQSDCTVFSFYANKNITTGEGGMIVTKDKDLHDRMKIMRLHGIDRSVFDRFRSKKKSWEYSVVEPGYKYNLTDIASAIGREQLKKLPKFHQRRQYLAENYFSELEGMDLILPPKPLIGDLHSWHLFVIQLPEEAKLNRDQMIDFLLKNNVGTSVHYKPLHLHPYWSSRYKYKQGSFPFSTRTFSQMVSIPLFTSLKDSEQNTIIDLIKKALR